MSLCAVRGKGNGKKAVCYEDTFVGLLLMVTFRPKLARSRTKAFVAANSSECTDDAFCMLVSADVLGQTGGSSLCVCMFVVEVSEVCGRIPDVASVSEVHISNSEAAADKFHSHCVRMNPPSPGQTLRYCGPPGSAPPPQSTEY